ncbi:RNA polymerase sigma factor region1.1 domain-containing protein [Thioalkalivibrio sp. HK1]|uniref:RNA polymerase sigma factor region1.1 domain-containing protein n=1 Tax=Thioalkalivibrio sp. HK1 TaxID=1469245 RepID=UPI000472E7EB|nr:RNA polymerase sigma factor region1.1 domain-containing protein [Thioalkalivibrio sp. HK1]
MSENDKNDQQQGVEQQEKESRYSRLISKGAEQGGYLTFDEVNDYISAGASDPEQFAGIVETLNNVGISVLEMVPDADEIRLKGSEVPGDDIANKEAATEIATIDADIGRTTDPIRMYMRSMGDTPLLDRKGEIEIAKRIEQGLKEELEALALYPPTIDFLLEEYDRVKKGDIKLTEIISGFIEPVVPPEQSAKPGAKGQEKEKEKEPDQGPDHSEADRRFKLIKRYQSEFHRKSKDDDWMWRPAAWEDDPGEERVKKAHPRKEKTSLAGSTKKVTKGEVK